MSLIVADTGPINYLIQIGHIELLSRLVGKMIIPSSVQAELLHDAAPADVRAWAAQAPAWVEIRVPREQLTEAKDFSATDLEVILLAKELNASLLLMDDQRARRYARALGVVTLGTLGLLEAAAARGLISLPAAIEKLRGTSFFITDELIKAALRRDTDRIRQRRT